MCVFLERQDKDEDEDKDKHKQEDKDRQEDKEILCLQKQRDHYKPFMHWNCLMIFVYLSNKIKMTK